MKKIILLIMLVFLFNCSKDTTEEPNPEPADNEMVTYFPEINSTTWETETISDLNWNEEQLDPLISFLEENNTKSFMILYNGRIVTERYLNDHTASSVWYWASAGKTLTTAMAGIAQEQNYINLDTKVSEYLGTGWTNVASEKEDLITCKNLLSMSSGLDDTTGDGISPEDLTYTADAGTRWAYHNVYVKMQDVITKTTNTNWDSFFNSELGDVIGMSGSWVNLNDLSVYWSDTRSMARFGLLMLANGKWDNSQIIPENFSTEATSTSQDINLAYGYLWWLNGKSSYHLPNTQTEFNGSLIPNAPNDMYAALGKNDQKIYVVPSKKLVVVRMGQAATEENFALSSFDNELWEKINDLID